MLVLVLLNWFTLLAAAVAVFSLFFWSNACNIIRTKRLALLSLHLG